MTDDIPDEVWRDVITAETERWRGEEGLGTILALLARLQMMGRISQVISTLNGRQVDITVRMDGKSIGFFYSTIDGILRPRPLG